jgi:hypothetical protein
MRSWIFNIIHLKTYHENLLQLLVSFHSSLLLLKSKLVLKIHESGNAKTILSPASSPLDCALPGVVEVMLRALFHSQLIMAFLRFEGLAKPASAGSYDHLALESRPPSPLRISSSNITRKCERTRQS